MSGLDFWNERFWLPNNITWADLRDTSTAKYPQVEDLLLAIPFSLALCLIRLLFERLVAQPVGACIGISPRGPRKPYPNPILERVFLTITQKPDEKRLKGLEKQLDCWNQYRIKQWFALRRAQLRPSKMSKFKESLWKLMYYTGIVGYGLYLFSEEDFFYDVAKCWKDYPFQPLKNSVRNYYIIQLSFYLSLSIAQMCMVKRKAFRHLMLHHCVSIVLMLFSYVDNFVRVGCIILITHDIADVWLETVRLLNYTKCGRLTHIVFAIFAIYFVATRLMFFPFWIINSTLVQSLFLPNIGFFPAYVIFNALLLSLLSLHVYWAITFARIALNIVYCYSSPTTPSSSAHISPSDSTHNLHPDRLISTLYSDSGMSESELNVADFNPTYWFRITPSSPSGSSPGAKVNGIHPVGLGSGTSNANGNTVHHNGSLLSSESKQQSMSGIHSRNISGKQRINGVSSGLSSMASNGHHQQPLTTSAASGADGGSNLGGVQSNGHSISCR